MFSYVFQSCYRNSCNLNTMTYGLLYLVQNCVFCPVSVFEALLWLGMGYMFLGPTCMISEFQNLSFCPLRRNCLMSLLVFFTIVHVFALIFVTVTILTHLCVFHCHFVCSVLLFQGRVTCRNCNPTGPLFSLSTSTFQLYSFNLNLQFDDSFHPQI